MNGRNNRYGFQRAAAKKIIFRRYLPAAICRFPVLRSQYHQRESNGRKRLKEMPIPKVGKMSADKALLLKAFQKPGFGGVPGRHWPVRYGQSNSGNKEERCTQKITTHNLLTVIARHTNLLYQHGFLSCVSRLPARPQGYLKTISKMNCKPGVLLTAHFEHSIELREFIVKSRSATAGSTSFEIVFL